MTAAKLDDGLGVNVYMTRAATLWVAALLGYWGDVVFRSELIVSLLWA